MTIKEVAAKDLDYLKKKKGCRFKLQSLIENFVNSGLDAIEIIPDDGEYKNISSLNSTMTRACKRSGYKVKLIQRNHRVFLVREIFLNTINEIYSN